MKTTFLIRPLVAATLACGLGAAPAWAVENGAPITPFGVYDFGAGMLPPVSPTATVGVRATHYHANQLRDNQGDRVPLDTDLTVRSLGLAVLKMTDVRLWGGQYGWAAVVPVLDMDLTLRPVGTGSNQALGDVQITPLIVGWQPAPGWFTNAQLSVQLPTGSYDKTRLVNAGAKHWTVTPSFAFTTIGATGLELSSNIQLNLHGRNRDTDYRSGIEYQHEFALGQHVGAWTLGLGGYLYQQLTDDRQNGATVADQRARALALGPALSYFQPGSGLPLMTLHAYQESSAKNRSQGQQVAFKAAWTF